VASRRLCITVKRKKEPHVFTKGAVMWYDATCMKTKLISQDQAAYICVARLNQVRENRVTDLHEFAREMLIDGATPRLLSRDVMWRILTGRYYPSLSYLGSVVDFREVNACGNTSPKSDEAIHDLKHSHRMLRSDILEMVRKLADRVAFLEQKNLSG
jgi:hypothetical protein